MRKGRLEAQCDLHDSFLPCGNETTFCVSSSQFCNGIANCPNGQDENFTYCDSQNAFSPIATIRCKKKDVYNVWTKAVKCNNIIECVSEEDENECSLPGYVLILILTTVLVFISLCAFLLWHWTVRHLPKLEPCQRLSEDDFDILHGSDMFKTKLHQLQNSKNAKDFNQKLIRMEMKRHNGLKCETVCCLKNSLDSTTTANIMKEFKSGKASFKTLILQKLKRTNAYRKIFQYFQKLAMLKIIKTAITHCMDLIKDLLILFEIVMSQGGWTLMMNQPSPFIKAVIIQT